jgi:tetratricopeptide (TPR) repeat protein
MKAYRFLFLSFLCFLSGYVVRSQTSEEYRIRANDLVAKGEYNLAIRAFTQAIEIDPSDSVSYQNRGVLKTNLGDYPGALEDLNKANELFKASPEAHFNRGHLYALMGEYENALHDLSLAVQIDSACSRAYNRRAEVRIQGFQDYPGAVADYKKFLSFDPLSDIDYSIIYANCAVADIGILDFAASKKDYSMALREKPDNEDIIAFEPFLRYLMKEYDTTLILCSSLLKKYPDMVFVYIPRILVNIELKSFKGASEDIGKLNKWQKRAPVRDWALPFLEAYFYYSQNDSEKARSSLAQAISIEPKLTGDGFLFTRFCMGMQQQDERYMTMSRMIQELK